MATQPPRPPTTERPSTSDEAQPQFNLLDEPWLPVLKQDGTVAEVGITQLLREAHTYTRLAADIEITNVALLRMLLAILYRSWDSLEWREEDAALEHWEEKWEQPTLWDADVERYLDTWRGRFDLRHPEHPFFQVATLATAKDSWKELSLLLPQTGFLTPRQDVSSFSAAEAARALVTCMNYDYSGIKSGAVGDDRVKGGRGYPMGTGWLGWMGTTVIEGSTLRDTLLLNYVPHRPHAGTDDRPLWEMDGVTSAARPLRNTDASHPQANGATGQVELLTWPQRRLRLRWEGDRADRVLVCNGDPVGYTVQDDVETMTAWRFSEPQSKKAGAPRYMPLIMGADRALWRSVSGLLPLRTRSTTTFKKQEGLPLQKAAKNVEWVGALLDEGILPTNTEFILRVTSVEYGTQSASYAGMSADALVVPGALLAPLGEELRERALAAVSLTDEVANLVSRFEKDLLFAEGGDPAATVHKGREQFYSAVDLRFRDWLRNLPDAPNQDAHYLQWLGTASQVATEEARALLSAAGPAVWAGKWNQKSSYRVTGATAMNSLQRGLWKLRPSGAAEYTVAQNPPDEPAAASHPVEAND